MSRTGAIFELLIEGERIDGLLNEAGGHRWQRVPPTERRGRVHTSTVTVAVFQVLPESEWTLKESDIEVFTTKDSGPGGQHRNKTESCVVMRHRPTGIEAKASAKSQHQNRKSARAMLEARVRALEVGRATSTRAQNRRQQVGSGMRGDKVRTYRAQDDLVTDHRSGRKARLSRIRAGFIEELSE
jgi:peptide chain release factor 1